MPGLDLDFLLKAEKNDELVKVYKEYAGTTLVAEYKAYSGTTVGQDCLKLAYKYQNSTVVGILKSKSTWSQAMDNALNSLNDFYSLDFNGTNEHLSTAVPSNLQFQPGDAFTLSAWIKPDNNTGSQVIVGTQKNSGTFAGYAMYNNAGQLSLDLYNQFSGSQFITKETSTAVITASTWQHVAITYDGSSAASGVTIYLDGVAQSTTTVTDGLTGTITYDADLQIGAMDGNNYNFDGKIAQVSIFNKELSQSEITELFNLDKSLSVNVHSAYSNCISWYRMGDDDDKAGSIISDAAGDNDLTMVNMNYTNFSTDVP